MTIAKLAKKTEKAFKFYILKTSLTSFLPGGLHAEEKMYNFITLC